MAEGARLESVFTGNRNVGSNPTPSANAFKKFHIYGGFLKADGRYPYIYPAIGNRLGQYRARRAALIFKLKFGYLVAGFAASRQGA